MSNDLSSSEITFAAVSPKPVSELRRTNDFVRFGGANIPQSVTDGPGSATEPRWRRDYRLRRLGRRCWNGNSVEKDAGAARAGLTSLTSLSTPGSVSVGFGTAQASGRVVLSSDFASALLPHGIRPMSSGFLPHGLVGVGDVVLRVGDVVLDEGEVVTDFSEGFAFAELGEPVRSSGG